MTNRNRREAEASNDTKPELELRSVLHQTGLRYRVDFPIPGTRRRADVAFPGRRLAVFVDGCFWHGCPDHGSWPRNNGEWWREKIEANRARDADTDRHLEFLGWAVVRVWEHENSIDAAKQVVARLGNLRAYKGGYAEPAG